MKDPRPRSIHEDDLDAPASVVATDDPRAGPWQAVGLLLGGAGLLAAGVLLGAGVSRPAGPVAAGPPVAVVAPPPVVVTAPPPPVAPAPTPAPAPPAAPTPGARPRLELALVVDTTGSMGGILAAARRTLWSLVDRLATEAPGTEVAIGLVAYRDRGDEYGTRVTPLTTDLEVVAAALDGLRARGGGDVPEDVSAGLCAALDELGWTRAVAREPGRAVRVLERAGAGLPRLDRALVLVGDAPDRDPARALELAREALARGVRVHTLRCGDDPTAARLFADLARAGGGQALAIDLHPRPARAATPFDEHLRALQARLERTTIAWGEAAAQARLAAQWARNQAAEVDPVRASARASALCKQGRLYGGDLLDALDAGRVSPEALAALERDGAWALVDPAAPWQGRPLPEVLAAARGERAAVRAKLARLVAERDAWLAQGGAPGEALERRLLEAVLPAPPPAASPAPGASPPWSTEGGC